MELAKATPSVYDKIMNSAPAIIIPVGAMEWHDEHLPFGFDYLKVNEICKKIAEEVGCFVAPPFCYGYPKHISNHPIKSTGTFCPEFDPLYQYMLAVGKMYVNKDFKVIYFLSGHYERAQIYLIKLISRHLVDYAREQGKEIISIAHIEPDFTIRDGVSLNAKEDYVRSEKNRYYTNGDHGGFFETSLGLYLSPDLVKSENIKEIYHNDEFGAPHEKFGKIWVDMMVQKATVEIHEALQGREPQSVPE